MATDTLFSQRWPLLVIGNHWWSLVPCRASVDHCELLVTPDGRWYPVQPALTTLSYWWPLMATGTLFSQRWPLLVIGDPDGRWYPVQPALITVSYWWPLMATGTLFSQRWPLLVIGDHWWSLVPCSSSVDHCELLVTPDGRWYTVQPVFSTVSYWWPLMATGTLFSQRWPL